MAKCAGRTLCIAQCTDLIDIKKNLEKIIKLDSSPKLEDILCDLKQDKVFSLNLELACCVLLGKKKYSIESN